jgi:hypothetical protein
MKQRLALARIFILLVTGWNVQASIYLIYHKQNLAMSLGVPGMSGQALILGIAVLFLMWNVPYIIAAIHPVAHRLSLVEALIMQAIALVGEVIIRGSFPALPAPLSSTISTYIIFDICGLVLLLAALLVTLKLNIPYVRTSFSLKGDHHDF